MAAERVKRKLAAILSADVKGYSRLMGEDEVGTIRTLNIYKEVMTGFIQNHQGRVVGTAGDSVLAEFASVVDAVQCAVEIQKELKTRNADVPESRRMEFRIGINLGDVVEGGDTIYGDGVNIAARLESLAEAGGICISGTAYDQVKNKIALGYEYVGEQAVKNIAEPVRVYHVGMEAGGRKAKKGLRLEAKGKRTLALGILAVLVAAVVALWQFYLRPVPPRVEVASKERMAFPLPDVPSIAVLPFANMSEDPNQEFLSDGMTEAIITALSRAPRLFVIARNSTFVYKGKPVKVKQVSEELGVQYVLEGSLQRSGDRVRVTAQLIDALTGHHLWAERYDRDLEDIFELQDEITLKILRAVQAKVTEGELPSVLVKYFRGKQGLDCYFKIMQVDRHLQGFNIADNNMARRMAEELVAMYPENPYGYFYLGYTYSRDIYLGDTKSPRETIEKGIELAQKVIAMDDSIPNGHFLLSDLYQLKREYDKAIAEGERAVALAPGMTAALAVYANALRFAGRPEEAIPLYQKAIRLNPSGPSYLYHGFGQALRATGRFEEAVSALKKAIQIAPDNILAHTHLAATYSMMGRDKEARAEVAEVIRINPKFSVDSWAKNLPFKDRSEIDKIINALRKAGLK